MDAVREALQYESMHEEVHEDEDVGDMPAITSPSELRHACSLLNAVLWHHGMKARRGAG